VGVVGVVGGVDGQVRWELLVWDMVGSYMPRNAGTNRARWGWLPRVVTLEEWRAEGRRRHEGNEGKMFKEILYTVHITECI
jgi:hypothetical protein